MSSFLLGVIFLEFSFLTVPTIKNDLKNLPLILFPIAGLGIVAFTSITMWGHKFDVSVSEKTIVTSMVIVFILGGASFVLGTVFRFTRASNYIPSKKSFFVPLAVGISLMIMGSLALYLLHFK